MTGVLRIDGVGQKRGYVVIKQSADEQGATVDVLFPRLLGLVNDARLRNCGRCVGYEGVGRTDSLVRLYAEVKFLVADGDRFGEQHVVPSFHEVGVGGIDDVGWRTLTGEDTRPLLPCLLIVGTDVATHALHLTALEPRPGRIGGGVEKHHALHELVATAAQARQLGPRHIGRGIAEGHLCLHTDGYGHASHKKNHSSHRTIFLPLTI